MYGWYHHPVKYDTSSDTTGISREIDYNMFRITYPDYRGWYPCSFQLLLHADARTKDVRHVELIAAAQAAPHVTIEKINIKADIEEFHHKNPKMIPILMVRNLEYTADIVTGRVIKVDITNEKIQTTGRIKDIPQE